MTRENISSESEDSNIEAILDGVRASEAIIPRPQGARTPSEAAMVHGISFGDANLGSGVHEIAESDPALSGLKELREIGLIAKDD